MHLTFCINNADTLINPINLNTINLPPSSPFVLHPPTHSSLPLRLSSSSPIMALTTSSSSPLDTILPPLAGGALIGLSAFYGAILHGRVTGISGELYSLATFQSLSSLHFLSGLSLTGLFLSRVPNGPHHLLSGAAETLATLSTARLAGGGFLVGLGAGVGNGCTSGHGVCGLARLSPRSIIATLTFMSSGIITASLFHSASIIPVPNPKQTMSITTLIPNAGITIPLLAVLPYMLAKLLPAAKNTANSRSTLSGKIVNSLIHASRGALFATGLTLSGMTHPGNTVRFMDVATSGWNPSLALVFAGALPIAFLGFRAANKKPMLTEKTAWPTRTDIDKQLVVGAAMFGVGWALVGVCPAPMVTVLGATPMVSAVQTVMAAMTVGVVVGKRGLWWIGKLGKFVGL